MSGVEEREPLVLLGSAEQAKQRDLRGLDGPMKSYRPAMSSVGSFARGAKLIGWIPAGRFVLCIKPARYARPP